MVWRPSDEIVRIRLTGLIERDGIEAVANRYSTAATASSRRQTVNRWLRGGTPHGRTARSIAVRGRVVTGPADRMQDPITGRVRYLSDPRAIAARDSAIRQNELQVQRMRAEARTPEDFETIEMRDEIDFENEANQFAYAWEQQLDELRMRTASGEDYSEGSELFVDWQQWRDDYRWLVG